MAVAVPTAGIVKLRGLASSERVASMVLVLPLSSLDRRSSFCYTAVVAPSHNAPTCATAGSERDGRSTSGTRRRDHAGMAIVSSSIEIDVPPREVYALLSDVTRTGEWSPECVRCRWLDGAAVAAEGVRYRGTSRNGWRRWSTTSTIRVARPEELTWDVSYLGRPVARWSYALAELGGGRTRLTESVDDRRERWLQLVSPWITGSRDRASRNAETIGTTLEHVKRIAERARAQPG
jgi:uncharacterized protein YndB with AHSA1/START domain